MSTGLSLFGDPRNYEMWSSMLPKQRIYGKSAPVICHLVVIVFGNWWIHYFLWVGQFSQFTVIFIDHSQRQKVILVVLFASIGSKLAARQMVMPCGGGKCF